LQDIASFIFQIVEFVCMHIPDFMQTGRYSSKICNVSQMFDMVTYAVLNLFWWPSWPFMKSISIWCWCVYFCT